MAKPTLALIPSAQGSKFYSVLPSNGVGDFDFTRSGSATRINKDGLIETVSNGVSRLNYPLIDGVVNGCPSHLLEPTRLQKIQYSEDFSQGYWSVVRANINPNQAISPNGTLTADLLTVTDTSENYTQTNVSITVSGTKQTVSCFVKKGTNDFAHILLWDTASNGSRQWFDVNNGTVESSAVFGSGVSVNSASIENYGNGWFRCIVVFNCSLTSVRTRISASNGDGQTNGTIGKTIFIWGYQVESNSSYPTSYIPNYGTAAGVTRSAETANGAGDASTFNDSVNGNVLMVEISALNNDLTNRVISLSDGSFNNRLYLFFNTTSNTITSLLRVGGSSQFSELSYVSQDITSSNKIAYKLSSTEFSLWVNGIKVSYISGNFNTWADGTINQLSFRDQSGGNPFYGNTKQLQYFDSALNDSDLEKITSWTSFTDMANGQLYSIK